MAYQAQRSGGASGTNVVRKTVTFDGLAGTGAAGTVALFTVTGQVRVLSISAYCSADLTVSGVATMTLGTTGAGQAFLGATTCDTLDVGEFWAATTPNANAAIPAAMKDILVTQNIIITISAANVTGGVVTFHVYWLPLSADGALAAA